MKQAPIPSDERSRIEALRALRVLDTLPEERFDRITRLAKRLFGVPIALVSLVDSDRQWFKSRQGLEACETPREISFCGHAIHRDEVMLVEDARDDDRFSDNPLVTEDPHIRFYAGCPLSGGTPHRLGTLCLIDREPRTLGPEDLELLHDLAAMVDRELEAVTEATLDALTGLSNRRGFEALASHAVAVCRRTSTPATLLFIDLNGFKQINDEHGHAEGDRVLVAFAGLLSTSFRDCDIVARMGGDEFCVLLTGASTDRLERPLRVLDEWIAKWNNQSPQHLGYSMGAVAYDPAVHRSLEDLVDAADQRMYKVKRGG